MHCRRPYLATKLGINAGGFFDKAIITEVKLHQMPFEMQWKELGFES